MELFCKRSYVESIIEEIIEEKRLPTTSETYLAWHEPLYYLALTQWIKIGELFEKTDLDWWESLNSIFYFCFLILIFIFSYHYSRRNKYIALLNVFLFSIFFVGLKLSTYVTNELLVHILIILLAYLFIRWKLLELGKDKIVKVIIWSIILGIATLVKLTAFIILMVVVIVWIIRAIAKRKTHPLLYILITIFFVTLINLPWFKYKQENFPASVTINMFEYENKQNILKSDAWDYLFTINTKTFTTYPYWFSEPPSFVSMFIADSFGDYYNLFNNPQEINKLPESEKILIKNGRYTSTRLFNTMLRINKIALLIFLIWMIGLIGSIINLIRKFDWYKFFLILLLFGGYAALIYNNLRFPYLERGVLKAAFIFFTFPILALLSYNWWWKTIKNKFLWICISFLPIIIYLIIAWPILKL